jgi:hypothetical protein
MVEGVEDWGMAVAIMDPKFVTIGHLVSESDIDSTYEDGRPRDESSKRLASRCRQ